GPHHRPPGHGGGGRVSFFLQLVANGVVVGGIYALVALGFVLIYKSSRVINFAQGEFLMVGAYVSLALMTTARVPPLPAFVLTLGFSIVLALLVERLVLRPLIGEPVIAVIMVTLGLASVLRAVIQLCYGTDTRPFPELFSARPFVIGVLENLSGGYLDPIFGGGVKEVAPFVVLVLILMIRPYGLFGTVEELERV